MKYLISQGIFVPSIEIEIEGTPPCLFCGEPVVHPSVNGPLVCGPCDKGRNPDGSRWDAQQSVERHRHSRDQVAKYRKLEGVPGEKRRSIVLEMAPDFYVPPGIEIQITSRLPLEVTVFRPDTFLFDDPTDWQITEFKIGHNSQIDLRACGAICARDMVSKIIEGRCDVVKAHMDITIQARPQKSGLRFRGELSGRWA